uniref:Peptidase S1 domain-containing protein n=1 Tax=Trichogramma kaykai TaxID=54128 RepID=A0ABD2VU28_9HYME
MIHCEALARVQSKRSRESSPPESMKVLVVVVVVVLLLPSFQTVVAEGTHSKIYQGEAAAKGEFPYQVSITVGGRHICGGSLVSAKHVLTAAHCVEEIVLSRRNFTRGIAVRTGSVMLGKGRNYLIRRISYHNGFRDSYRLFLPNDIAVVQLQKPVELSDYVKPIHLPEYRAELPEGSKVIVTGFGTTISNDLSPVLKKLVTETFSNTKCGNYFLRLTGRRVMTSQICAEKKRGDGTCTRRRTGGSRQNHDLRHRLRRRLLLRRSRSHGLHQSLVLRALHTTRDDVLHSRAHCHWPQSRRCLLLNRFHHCE